MDYLYEAINTDRYEIRILRLDLTERDDIISGRLIKASLLEELEYTALSYCWGDESVMTNAMLNGTPIPVTVNLDKALRYLRQRKTKLVWVDAICINQSDLTEKSLQVRNMKQIYHQATTTIAWLGDHNGDEAEMGLKFLNSVRAGSWIPPANDGREDYDPARSLNSPAPIGAGSPVLPVSMRDAAGSGTNAPPQQSCRYHRLSFEITRAEYHDDIPLEITQGTALRTNNQESACPACIIAEGFGGLIDLFQRPYWKRRWIIQEIVVSSRLQIVCGQTTINLEEMKEAVGACRKSKYWYDQHDIASSYYTTLVGLHQQHSHEPISMLHALSSTLGFLSTDPRDVIFALLGISSDGATLVPLPSYHLRAENIAISFTRALLR